jgi:hypothetical protein
MMADEETINLQLTVDLEDADREEVDRLARQLLEEIHALEVESARLAQAEAPPEGAKGDSVALGSILVTALPAVLPTLVEAISSWVQRAQGRSVKFKGEIGGIVFEFQGPGAEFKALLAQMNKTSPPPEPSSPSIP